MGNEDITLLVVDDTELNRKLLRRRLGSSGGYRVLVAESGERALEILEDQSVDLLILDIMMPGMSGIELLSRLRDQSEYRELPVIIASSKAESDDMVEALDAGANDYVTKPFDFPVLLARIKTQLRSSKMRKRDSVPPEIGSGSVLEERYRLDSMIGVGSFGAVFRGTHLGLDNPVAVKILQAARGNSPEARKRFRIEGISACRIKHPNAVTVLDFGVTEHGVAYLVMELLEGRSLDQALSIDPILAPWRCAEIVVPVCEVLAQAHSQGIIHRDVKPANIFLHRGTKGEIVKVLDFGIAKLSDETDPGSLTMEGSILGTPAYMAPERFSKIPSDGRADVYSLGVTLYKMLSGRQLFPSEGIDLPVLIRMQIDDEPDSLAELRPELPEKITKLVHRCLRKNPSERPDALELAHLLADAVGMQIDWPAIAEALKKDLEADTIEPDADRRTRARTSNWVSKEEADATESMLLSTPHEESEDIVGARDLRQTRDAVLFDLNLAEDEVSLLLDSLDRDKED